MRRLDEECGGAARRERKWKSWWWWLVAPPTLKGKTEIPFPPVERFP